MEYIIGAIIGIIVFCIVIGLLSNSNDYGDYP